MSVKLTAEQVESIVGRNCKWYEGGEIDAQAIADELNATLGAGIDHYGTLHEEIVRCRDCKHFHKTAPHRYRPKAVMLREFVEANKPHMTWNELYDAAAAEGFGYKNADSLRHSYVQLRERHLKYRCLMFGTNDPDGFCAWGEKVEG